MFCLELKGIPQGFYIIVEKNTNLLQEKFSRDYGVYFIIIALIRLIIV